MPLTPGTRLGVYEVTAQIGAGGMGEVYRATDSNLKRSVAIKVLPAAVAGDADRLARFQREAEVLAALNHPNIGAIYGLEKTPDFTALVMELVEGEDLSQRIARGALPLDEALPIAKQIADALEAAHEQGIIHRDLKPANIKVRSDGTVKVLDFGLAKAMEPAAGSSSSLSMSPTLSMHATQAGIILGTAAYMAPEQARGKTVDRRADIWAFGVVLFEMLAGTPPFPGEDISHVLARVIERDADWTALPPALPPALATYLRRCLAKDPRQRIRDIGDMRLALEGAFEPPVESVAVGLNAMAERRPIWRHALPLVITSIVTAAIIGVVAWTLQPSAPKPTITRFAVPLGEGQRFTNDGRQLVAVSPDGTRIAYVANRRLYMRTMSELEARPIAGTESTQTTNPVFSPDGESLAFYAPGGLRKIAISGGAAVPICSAANPFGMSWDHDEILFGGSDGIMRVSANGGTPERLVAVKSGEVAHGPQLLPGGQAVLFTVTTGNSTSAEFWDKAQIVVQALTSGERKTLVSGGADARYVPTGHVVYAVGGVLFAQRFDPRTLAASGGPVSILEGVARSSPRTGVTPVAHFAISGNGFLVYVPGPASMSMIQPDQVAAFMDRQGTVQPLKLPAASYRYPRVSPDGTRMAIATDDGKAGNIWIYDLAGTSARRQLTLEGNNRFPIWSADGQRVTFQSDREGDLAIFWQRADGAGAPERLTKPEPGTAHVPESWAPDGKTLLVSLSKGSSYSLWAFSTPSKQAAAYGGIEASAGVSATFSPDGHWVAYSLAYTTGGSRIFVQPFPATAAKYQIADGVHPFWSLSGKELFFHQPGQRFGVSGITTTPSFAFTEPAQLPIGDLLEGGAVLERNIDITPDGKHFLGVIDVDPGSRPATTPQIRVVENWFEELKARVPTK